MGYKTNSNKPKKQTEFNNKQTLIKHN